MHYLNVWLTVRDPADVEKIRGWLAECVRLSRAEPGCVRYDVYHSQTEPAKFLLVEHWQAKADWETHRTAKAFTEIYQPHVLPRVDRQPHVATLVEA
jgi:quinol monooxygenase YgiN